MALTEQQIQNWARALSDTENDKCVRTVASIRKVLEDHFGTKVKVSLQGSYANSTNVRQDSDVDIVVCYQDAYYSDLQFLTPQDKIYNEQNKIPHDYTFFNFKNEVEVLLRENFGTSVERKEKCIRINGNASRVNADVVPCFVLNRFISNPYRIEVEGVQLFTDSGNDPVINFPIHHKKNGETKNQSTDQKYKAAVRILKNCRNNLVDNKKVSEKVMPSFLLESLVWNVPDPHFKVYSHKDMVNNVIRKIYNDMSEEEHNKYAEINDLMWLKKNPSEIRIFLEHVHNIIN